MDNNSSNIYIEGFYWYFHVQGEKMMRFACKDLGMDCNFVATGASKDEVYKKAMEHGAKAHADLMKNMTKQELAAFDAKLQAAIKTA